MKVSEEKKIESLIAYKNGEKRIVDIASELDVAYTTVSQWIKKADVRKRTPELLDWARIKNAVNKVEL